VVVGFGISRRDHVAQVAAHADGVVVGSALVNVIRDRLDRRGEIAPALGALAADLAAGNRPPRINAGFFAPCPAAFC